LKLLEPSIANVGQQFLGSLDQVREGLARGSNVGVEALQPFFNKVIATFEGTKAGPAFARTEVAAAQLGLSKQQFEQSLQLARIINSGNKVQDEMKKAQEEEFKNVRNARERANKFFDKLAPEMQKGIAEIAPSIIFLAQSLGGASTGSLMLDKALGGLDAAGFRAHTRLKVLNRKFTRSNPGLGKAANLMGGFAPMALAGTEGLSMAAGAMGAEEGGLVQGGIGALGAAAQGAMFGAALGPIGALLGGTVGGAIGIYQMIAENTEKTAEELEKQRQMEEQRDRDRRAREAAVADTNFRLLTSLAQQQRLALSPDGEALQEESRLLRQELRALRAEQRRPSTGPRNSDGSGN
jgi:hypothetical protein